MHLYEAVRHCDRWMSDRHSERKRRPVSFQSKHTPRHTHTQTTLTQTLTHIQTYTRRHAHTLIHTDAHAHTIE